MTADRPWYFTLSAHDEGEPGSGEAKGSDEPGSSGESGDDGLVTMRQEDFDRVISRRLQRERERIRDEYGDLEELKTAAEELEEIRAAERSELEQAQERIAELERSNEQLQRAQQENRTRRALEQLAHQRGFHDPADAYSQVDHSRFEFDDDGSLDNAEELVEELVETKPYLVASPNGEADQQAPHTPQGSADQGARSTGGETDYMSASDEDFKQALGKFGLRARR